MMNYEEIRNALNNCERYDKYVKQLKDLDKRAQVEVKSCPDGATYRLLKALFSFGQYDTPEFERFIMPPDILAIAIHSVAERIQESVDKDLGRAKKLLQEGLLVEDLGKKEKK